MMTDVIADILFWFSGMFFGLLVLPWVIDWLRSTERRWRKQSGALQQGEPTQGISIAEAFRQQQEINERILGALEAILAHLSVPSSAKAEPGHVEKPSPSHGASPDTTSTRATATGRGTTGVYR